MTIDREGVPLRNAVYDAPRLILFRRFWIRELLTYLMAAILAAMATIFALKLWNATFSIPLNYRADSIITAMNIDAVLKTGWYEHQPQLAAPFGQVFHDFPAADNLHLVIIWIIGRVFTTFGSAMNAYYLLGFPLAALTAVWFFRTIGLGRAISVALGVLFAVAPYHFFRAESHYFLASYWPIPLFAVLIVRVLLGKSLWERGRRTALRLGGFLTWRNVGTLVILGIAGSATQYYAVFDLVVLALAAAMTLARDRNIRRLLGYAYAWCVIAVVLFINMLPDFIYAWQNGPDYVAAYRPAIHSEWFAIKVVMLFLPSDNHRLAPLAELARSYEAQFPTYTMTGLGFVAGFGFLVLMIALTRLAGSLPFRRLKNRPRATARLQKSVLHGFAGIALWIILLASSGGLAVFIALLVTTKVRGWDRFSIYLSLLGLAAAGLAVQFFVRWLIRRRNNTSRPRSFGSKFAMTIVAAMVLLVGVWDQTNVGDIPAYETTKANFVEDASYTAALERALPKSAMIFELPYQPFPEGPPVVNGMQDYDELRLSLHTKTLQFSNGGVKGRPQTDWPSLLSSVPALPNAQGVAAALPLAEGELPDVSTTQMLDRVAASGFAGVSIDRLGYADGAKFLEAQIAQVLNEAPIVSKAGTYSFWSLAKLRKSMVSSEGLAAVQALGYETTHPVMAYGAWPGLTASTNQGVGQTWQSTADDTKLDFATNSSSRSSIHATFFLGQMSGVLSMTLTLPGGEKIPIPVQPAGSPVSVSFTVSPGHNYLYIDAKTVENSPRYLVQNLEFSSN